MKNSSKPTSKKCSTLKTSAALALVAALLSVSAQAAVPAAKTPTRQSLTNDLLAHSKTHQADFQTLIDRWETQYGGKASPALLSLAEDRKLQDQHRFIALMAVTRLEGSKAAPKIRALLKDKKWMIRSAAMKALVALDDRASGPELLKLLKDPALVIRAEAATLIGKMNPPGAAEALLAAAYDPANYRPANYKKGKADWVPQRALASLRTVKPAAGATGTLSAKLLPLLNEANDRKLRAHALFTIESIEGRSLKKGAPFSERAKAWTDALKPVAKN